MAMDPVSALFAIRRLTEIDWRALVVKEWFPNNYDEGKIMMLPLRPPLAYRNASGTEACKGALPKAKPNNPGEFANCGMSMKYVRLAWHRYLEKGTDVKVIATLEERDVLSRPASSITSAAVDKVEAPAASLLPCSAIPSDQVD